MRIHLNRFLISTILLFISVSSYAQAPLEELAEKYQKNAPQLTQEALHSLDTFKLLNQTIIEGLKQAKFSKIIDVRQVEVNLFSTGNTPTESLNFNTERPMLSTEAAEIIRLSFQERTFHEIKIKASQVITYNQKIFFKTA